MALYGRRGFDDVSLRWTKEAIAKGRDVGPYWRELAAMCDEFSIDLTSLLRDYDLTRSALRIKYRPLDVSQLVYDMDEPRTKRELIELVGLARKLSGLCDVLLRIAVERAQKARTANAAKGAQRMRETDAKARAKAKAKAVAQSKWPEAKRKGWTALQFHTVLAHEGHVVAPDTVRKWMTALRKTGVC